MNPLTRSMTCPFNFYPLHIGQELKVCISTQLENADKYSIPFGGFISCESGNPLAGSSSNLHPKHCPRRYKKFLASVDEGCEINYCAQMESDFASRPPKIPPFHSKPGLKVNISQSMVIQGPYGELWIRDDQGHWITANKNTVTGKEVLEHFASRDENSLPSSAGIDQGDDDSDYGSPSAVVTVLIVTTCILAATLVVILVVFSVYSIRKYKRVRGKHVSSTIISRAYSSIDGDNCSSKDDENITIMDSQEKNNV